MDLEKGTVSVARQYSHGAWADLKTDNARRTIPLPATVRDELRARYDVLNGNVVRLGRDDRTVFCAPEGGPLDYKNFRDRVWAPLLKRTGPDEKHPNREVVMGTIHKGSDLLCTRSAQPIAHYVAALAICSGHASAYWSIVNATLW